MTGRTPFFAVHSDLPCERPGGTADVAVAGYEGLGTRTLDCAALEAYCGPMTGRTIALRSGVADRALSAMRDICAAEVVRWRYAMHETGHLQTVAPWQG